MPKPSAPVRRATLAKLQGRLRTVRAEQQKLDRLVSLAATPSAFRSEIAGSAPALRRTCA